MIFKVSVDNIEHAVPQPGSIFYRGRGWVREGEVSPFRKGNLGASLEDFSVSKYEMVASPAFPKYESEHRRCFFNIIFVTYQCFKKQIKLNYVQVKTFLDEIENCHISVKYILIDTCIYNCRDVSRSSPFGTQIRCVRRGIPPLVSPGVRNF